MKMRGISGKPLSPAEMKIARLVAEGWNNRVISEQLNTSRQMVKNFCHAIGKKLDLPASDYDKSLRVMIARWYWTHTSRRGISPMDEVKETRLVCKKRIPVEVRGPIRESEMVTTAHGRVRAEAGDYILRDPATNDMWPIKPDIYAYTYEPFASEHAAAEGQGDADWNNLRLEVVSWGGRAVGYLRGHDKEISERLDAALKKLIAWEGAQSATPPAKAKQHCRACDDTGLKEVSRKTEAGDFDTTFRSPCTVCGRKRQPAGSTSEPQWVQETVTGNPSCSFCGAETVQEGNKFTCKSCGRDSGCTEPTPEPGKDI